MEREKLHCLYRRDTRRPASSFSREEAVRNRPLAECVNIYGSKEHWAAFSDEYILTCLGPRVFWKKIRTVNTTYKNGKLYGTVDPFRNQLIEIFNFNWLSSNDWALRLLGGKKDLWKDILSDKITNPEMLCKNISKRYFKGAYSYRTLRRMAEGYNSRVSLWDLYYHSTNPEEALKLLIDPKGMDLFIIEDTIQYCKILDTKFNPLWSMRRIIEEHQKQIEILNARKIEGFSDELLTAPYSSDGLSLILDERTCFAEGCRMHNCVHSCYWRQIADGFYLIAKGEINGEYVDLGMSVTPDAVVFQQVHTIYNGNPSSETIKACHNWITFRQNELQEIAKEIKSNKITGIAIGTVVHEDLPWL